MSTWSYLWYELLVLHSMIELFVFEIRGYNHIRKISIFHFFCYSDQIKSNISQNKEEVENKFSNISNFWKSLRRFQVIITDKK